MKQGEAIRLDFILTQPDSSEPLNLTHVSLQWGLALNEALTIYKTTNDDIDITDAVKGLCSVFLYTEDTEDVVPKKYKYELWQTDTLEDENPLAEGYIIIKQTSIRNRPPA